MGIDPGTTTAFAALNLDGKIISVGGSKKYSGSVLLEELRKIGRTVMIATDKEKAPNFVKRLSARMKAKLFVPDHDLGVKEKKELAYGHGFIGHKRDSLAAALFAYNFYEPLFKKIDTIAPRKERDEVKKKILLDEAINIRDALRERKEKEKGELKKRRERVGDHGLSKLKRDNAMLRRKIKSLEEKLKNIESIPRGRIHRDTLSENRLRTIRQMSKELERRKQELDYMGKKNKVLSFGGVPIEDEIFVSGKKVVVGKGKRKGEKGKIRRVIHIDSKNLKVLEMDGVEYVMLKDVEKVIANEIVKGLLSEYRKNHH